MRNYSNELINNISENLIKLSKERRPFLLITEDYVNGSQYIKSKLNYTFKGSFSFDDPAVIDKVKDSTKLVHIIPKFTWVLINKDSSEYEVYSFEFEEKKRNHLSGQ